MTSDRYTHIVADGGFYVYDRKDGVPVGDKFDSKFEAEMAASKKNRRERDRLLESLLDKVRQWVHSGDVVSKPELKHLIKALGDLAAEPSPQAESSLLVFLASCALRRAVNLESSL